LELAEQVGGRDKHGFRFVQVPIGVMMPEALVETWQHYRANSAAAAATTESEAEMKVLIAVCNILKMNVMISKPILEGKCRDTRIDTIKNIQDPVAKHLQLIRSLPPRCVISTMCGMKKVENLKKNFEVIKDEPLTRAEFTKAMTPK